MELLGSDEVAPGWTVPRCTYLCARATNTKRSKSDPNKECKGITGKTAAQRHLSITNANGTAVRLSAWRSVGREFWLGFTLLHILPSQM